MSEQTHSKNKKFTCLECKNETELTQDYNEGDVVECNFCGIEYEVAAKADGDYTLQMIEEEK
jgi:transcription elongation factor Elf1